jgi:hypothetical protein
MLGEAPAMIPRPGIAVALFVFLAGLGMALRHDLGNLAWHQARQSLSAGDPAGAELVQHSTIFMDRDRAPLSAAIGVGWYRQQRFAEAERQFAVATASTRPELVSAAHLNRGNSLFRRAGQLAEADVGAASLLLRAAMADFEKVLSLEPNAGDAISNLRITRERLARLEAVATPSASRPTDRSYRNASRAASGASQTQEGLGSQRDRGDAISAVGGNASSKESAEAHEMRGRSRRDLTRNDAERLLDESRGREGVYGTIVEDRRQTGREVPEKDW